MLKKVLYVTVSFILGFMLITNVIYSNFISVFQDNVNDSVASEDYVDAARYYSYVVDSNVNNKIIINEKDNPAYVEIYPSVNERAYTVKNKEGAEKAYRALEPGVSFTFFNINEENFKLSESEKGKGGVEFVYDNDERLFFPFVSGNMDHYKGVSLYSYLPFDITNAEYNEKVALDTDSITSTSVIRKVLFKDGSGEVKFEYVNSDSKLTFNTQIYSDFNEVLTEYANIQKEAAINNLDKVDESISEPIIDRYNKIANNNPNYLLMHEQNLIFKSGKFLTPVILISVGFLALDILVAWLLFKKKKGVNSAPKQNEQKQPEQFSRDIFDAEEESVEEAQIAEEVSEEENTKTSTDE